MQRLSLGATSALSLSLQSSLRTARAVGCQAGSLLLGVSVLGLHSQTSESLWMIGLPFSSFSSDDWCWLQILIKKKNGPEGVVCPWKF